MQIVADHRLPYLKGVLEKAGCKVRYIPGNKIDNQSLNQCDALLTRSRTRVNQRLLQNTKVAFVATATIGFDHLDTAYLDSQRIVWSNAPGCNAGGVQQYIVAALLYLIRKHALTASRLTLGVIGAGHVGSRVVKSARALGMKVLINDPPRADREGSKGFTALEYLLPESDIVSMHVPLTKSGKWPTKHLASTSFFSQMKRGSFFLNSARGPVCDQKALKEAMASGVIKDAVLDVWEEEPLTDPWLLKHCSLTTPHIAGYSLDGKANATGMIVQALSRHFSLGLDDWKPEIPRPENPALTFSLPSKLSTEEILQQAVRHAYLITKDSENLKAHPTAFEEIRNSYPPRWEFGNYSVSLPDNNKVGKQILQEWGFRF